MNAELLELLQLDSLPQEHRRELARRLRAEQIRRYNERERATSSDEARPSKSEREGERKVRFQPKDRVRDAVKRRDLEEG